MKVGGSPGVVEAVKAAGGQPGPVVNWQTSGVANWGYGGYETALDKAKSLGVPALVQVWLWGDDIRPAAIRDGVRDRYNSVWKTKENLLGMVTQFADRAKARGVAPWFVIDTEHNKNGTEGSPEWLAYFRETSDILHTRCPGCRVVWAPGDWHDLAVVAAKDATALEKADMVGVRAMRSLVRQSRDSYLGLGNGLLKAARQAHSAPAAAGKAMLVTDFALSTYGGSFSTTHPFGGGDGRAAEGLQVEAFERVGSLLPELEDVGIEAMCYRASKDSPNFNVENWYGYAERFFGVVRADGSAKPGKAALMKLAVVEDPCAQVRALLEQAQREAEGARAELARVRTDLELAQTGRQVAEADRVELRARLEAVRQAGGWT